MFARIEKLDDIRAVVEAEEDFYIAERDDYYVANYRSIMARFPDPHEEGIGAEEQQRRLILRECRGILFDKSGNIISRPLSKFNNLGEGQGYQPKLSDFDNFAAYDKVDGSMMRPVKINGKIRWCSKAGVTHLSPEVEAFVTKHTDYADMAMDACGKNVTAIFEYQAPAHIIVVPVKEEKLTLLAVRDNVSGRYYDYEELVLIAGAYNIPLVKRWEMTDIEQLKATVKELKGAEGVVIVFANDERVKLKADDYCLLHKTKSSLESLKNRYECYVSDTLDDIMPLIRDNEFMKELMISEYETYLNFKNGIETTVTDFYNNYGIASGFDRKSYALKGQEELPQNVFSIAMNLYLGKDIDWKQTMIKQYEHYQKLVKEPEINLEMDN